MEDWWDDPRFPWVISAILGMLAGIAAKQAVTITSGEIPKPLMLLADFLVLGIVFIIVMYAHTTFPSVPPEGIALMAASLAMWGPRGIAALVAAIRKKAAKTLGLEVIEPVDPVHRATSVETAEQPANLTENQHAIAAPIRKMRDKIPLEENLPVELMQDISKLDEVSYPDKNTGGNDV